MWSRPTSASGGGLPAALVPQAYVEAVTTAGAGPCCCRPTITTPTSSTCSTGWSSPAAPTLGPALYGAEPGPLTLTRPDRDGGESALLRRALERDKPVLGVCRGMQLLVAAAGGRLHQHLPDLARPRAPQPGARVYGEQVARFVPGSRVAGLLGADAEIRCHHHQGVADAGGLVVTGRTDDGLPEAVEHSGAQVRCSASSGIPRPVATAGSSRRSSTRASGPP